MNLNQHLTRTLAATCLATLLTAITTSVQAVEAQTSWDAPYSGSFFLVGADHGDWQSWGKSNIATVEYQEPEESSSNAALLNVRGSVYSSTSLELFWDVPADQIIQQVEIIRDDGVMPAIFVDGRSFYEKDLTPNTTYNYSLFPYDENGNIGEISYVSLTTNSDFSTSEQNLNSDTIYTNGINTILNNPNPDNLIGLAPLVYSDSTLELIWPRTSAHENDSHHIVYQNGKQIAISTGYSYVVDGLQAGTVYAFEVRRIVTEGSVADNYRHEARTRGTAPNIGDLRLNASALYQSVAPTAIAEIDSDFDRVKYWLSSTHAVPGFDPEKLNPEEAVEFIGSYACPLAGTVTVEQYDSPYNDKHFYTFDQCQFPQTSSEPGKYSTETLYYFSVLDGRLEREEFVIGDSGGSSRSFELRSDIFTATRHNGSVVTMQGSAEQGYEQAVLKATSLPNGDAVVTKTARYNLDSFSDSAVSKGTRFESIRTNLIGAETNNGIYYSIEQLEPVRIFNAASVTTFAMVTPTVFNVTDNTVSADLQLNEDNVTAHFISNGNLRSTTFVSESLRDGSFSSHYVPFHEEENLPRDLITQFCVWQSCNFGERIVDANE